MDTKGIESAAPFIQNANPTHPSLIDTQHQVATLYHVVNVPTAVCLDEMGKMIRPAEVAFLDNHYKELHQSDMTQYLANLKDWIKQGEKSPFALSAKTLQERQKFLQSHTHAAVYFQMGVYLHTQGHWKDAIPYFKTAQKLCPESWCYKRQAWQLSDAKTYYETSFQAEFQKLGNQSYYSPLNLPVPR